MKSEVTRLLEEYPHLRDSDEKLIANIWWTRIQNITGWLEPEQLTGIKKLLEMLSSGDLPNVKTIVRWRQKAQEEDISLRGKAYEKRHSVEPVWRDEFRK